jgi:hypothetical protein
MVIFVRNIVDACDTNAQGAIVRNVLDSYLRDGTHVTLDFSGVFNVTSSFVNTAFSDLLDDYDFGYFKSLVSLKNVNRQASALIKSRMNSAFAKKAVAA